MGGESVDLGCYHAAVGWSDSGWGKDARHPFYLFLYHLFAALLKLHLLDRGVPLIELMLLLLLNWWMLLVLD